MKFIMLVLTILFLFLQYEFWFAPGGLVSVYHLCRDIAQQRKINKNLSRNNQLLISNINDLKVGQELIEERARNNLGMIKKGEVFYQFTNNVFRKK